MIKLIAADLDNTLLRRDKTISDYTKGVFARVRERGVLLCYATSRSETSSKRFTAQIAPDLFISNRGALARRGNETLYKRIIPPGMVAELLGAAVDNPDVAHITMEAENGYFNTKPHDGWAGAVDYAHAVRTDFKTPMDYGDAYKLTLEIPNAEAANALVARFPALSAVRFVGEDWYAFAATGVSKEAALTAVLAATGISAAETAAFGDDGMDAGMLALAGYGIAVANAVDAVKRSASGVCEDCDEDGVARWVERNALLGNRI